jgi:hypothetical protein
MHKIIQAQSVLFGCLTKEYAKFLSENGHIDDLRLVARSVLFSGE